MDDIADLAADKFGRQIVGPLVEEQIAKDADKRQPAIGPARLELTLPRLFADCEGRFHVEIEVEAGDRRLRPRPQPGIIGLHCRLVFRVQLLVVCRDRVIRRPLEDVEVGGLLGDQRDRLDRRRAGADHADALTGEVHALMRPMTGVVGRTGKPVDAGDLRHVGR